jgi:CelD/BcsL family acetyltransferase involved in cellulose biosynthesis
MAELAVSVIDDVHELAQLRPAWRAVFASSPDRNIFLTWEWAYTWWCHFGCRDKLHVIVVRDGSDVVAIAPLLDAASHPWLGYRMLVGIGQEDADYGGFLLGADPESTGTLILDHLEEQVGRSGSVNFTRLREDSTLLSLLRRRFGLREGGRTLVQEMREEYPFLELARFVDPWRQVAALEKRNDVRRRLRRLRERHDINFDYESSAVQRNVDRFLALHDHRWAKKREGASGIFVSNQGRAFVRDVAQALDECGYVRLSFLNADEKPIAARLGFEFDGIYLGMKSAFDPAFAPFGPGHLIVAMVLEEMAARGLEEFDFMRGAGAHKTAWANGTRMVGYWTLRRPGLIGHRRLWLVLRRRRRLRGE